MVRPEPAPAEVAARRTPREQEDADEPAYRRLDSEVGRIAADVVTRRLEFRRGVARVAAAAARRPDLLERLVETERRLQGALLGGSPPSGVTLELINAARGVIGSGGSGERSEQRELSADHQNR
jgi:hypothetical protein